MDKIIDILDYLKKNKFLQLNTTSSSDKTTWTFRFSQTHTNYDFIIEKNKNNIELSVICMSYYDIVKIPKCIDNLFDIIEVNSRVMMRTRYKPNVVKCNQQTIAYARM